MTAEYWRWCPRWNRLDLSTSCCGSSACLQSLSSVLCRTAYGLESPGDKLGGTHAQGSGHLDKQFVSGAGIMQVEHTADCFGGAWLKLPLSTEVWHPRHIRWETAFQFAEVLALNGETYVFSVNEFSATCNWQVVAYKLNRTGAKTEPWGRLLRWGLQELMSLPMCTLKRRSRSKTHQSCEPIWHAFTKFVKKTSVPEVQEDGASL